MSPTTASEGSVYFDAPTTMNSHSDNGSGSDHDPAAVLPDTTVNRKPTLIVINQPANNNNQQPAKDDYGHIRAFDPDDIVYVDGNWVQRPLSEHTVTATELSHNGGRGGGSTPSLEYLPASVDDGHQNGTRYTENGLLGEKGDMLGNGGAVHTVSPVEYEDGEGEEFENLHRRTVSADASLTPKQKSKIVRKEIKEGKQLGKVIKKGGKIEKEAVSVAIKELSELQAVHKAALKAESRAHTAKTISFTHFQKCENAYHAARTKYESAQAELAALDAVLDTSRRNASEATEVMQEKMREVELLRAQKGVDDRERQVKLVELTGTRSTLRKWL